MPRPVDQAARYLPGLDGVRALAVALVVLYHLGWAGASGGLLGVGVFFTLSGYLITSLLIGSYQRDGRIDLRTFWLRRARRLLPAVVLVLGAVLLATVLTDIDQLGARLGQSLAALLYVANWTAIANGDSYFDRIAGPQPLEHLWSLSVEEQFYVIWPLLLVALLYLFRRNAGRPALFRNAGRVALFRNAGRVALFRNAGRVAARNERRIETRSGPADRCAPATRPASGCRLDRVAWVTTGLAVVSFVLLAILAKPGLDQTRAYEGTDTRAGGLLLGAVLAIALAQVDLRRATPRGVRTLDVLGFVGLGTIVLLAATTTTQSMWIYRGGLLLLTIATLALLVAVAHPGTRVGKALAVAPMRWIGERSYGIYLWHMPVIAFFPERTLAGAPVVRAMLMALLTLLLAAVSWRYVEDPIRRFGLVEAVRRSRLGLGHATTPGKATSGSALRRPRLGAAAAGTVVLAVACLVVPARILPQSIVAAAAEPPAPGPARPTGPVHTSCRSVVHVGDSTSLGLNDPRVLTGPKTYAAQLRRVGVQQLLPEISGARSIVETFKGQPNAQSVVQRHRSTGYRGCWVLALGTNETANQAVGGNTSLDQRIDLVMSKIGGQPALWTTVRTLKTSGPYAEANSAAWRAALQRAAKRYPNLRIYDWAAEVKNPWYIPDGIHFTPTGYAERSKRLATALAVAFPRDAGSPTSAVVRAE